MPSPLRCYSSFMFLEVILNVGNGADKIGNGSNHLCMCHSYRQLVATKLFCSFALNKTKKRQQVVDLKAKTVTCVKAFNSYAYVLFR